jgi:four helix bundle protein
MGTNESINFLTYSYASATESKSQLYRALDRKYITQGKADELFYLIEEIKKVINALISYLDKSDFRGQKIAAATSCYNYKKMS